MATRPTEELIIDRTLSDVNNLRTKGNYNATDLNRVEKWCKYLMELLNEYGYYVSIVTKTDWEIGLGKDRMFSEITRIKTNIQKLKDAFFTMQSTPEVPSTDKLSINYIEANNIEKIFRDIEYLLYSMQQDFIYCGVANCGQSRMWQGRFRRLLNWFAVPFNTFNNVPENLTMQNISSSSDSIANSFSQYASVYGTILLMNEKYDELDELIGGINDN